MTDRRGFFGRMLAAVLGWLGWGVARQPAWGFPVTVLPPERCRVSERIELCPFDPRGTRLPVGARLQRSFIWGQIEDRSGYEVNVSFSWDGDNHRRMIDDLTTDLYRTDFNCRASRVLVGHAYGNVYYADYAFEVQR